MDVDFSRIGRAIQQSQRQREADQFRHFEVQGAVEVLTGEFLIENTGESVRQVNFPVLFTEKPLMFFGSELYGNTITDGSFPIVSTTVIQYLQRGDDSERRYFTGASLATRSSGPSGQKIWVHWMAVGKALSAPLFGDDVVEGVI